ncbi:MAG: hypothetical protein WBV74_07945, partial [Pseudonocardiaceae bacterium]
MPRQLHRMVRANGPASLLRGAQSSGHWRAISFVISKGIISLRHDDLDARFPGLLDLLSLRGHPRQSAQPDQRDQPVQLLDEERLVIVDHVVQ